MKVEASGFDQPQVITRTGEAPAVPEEKTVLITGTLKAPCDYLEHKMMSEITRLVHSEKGYEEVESKLYEIQQSSLLVDRIERTLILKLNQKNHTTDEIQGVLTEFKLWDELKVNTGHAWSIDALRKFLKKIKFYFKDWEKHGEFLTALQNFVGKVESNYKDISKSGEFEISKVHKLMSDLPIPSFAIEAPIYNGYEKKAVHVEVYADVSDASVKFSLESEDLFTLQEKCSEEYIDNEISRIKNICGGDTEISIIMMS
jgi:hypothetical protein